MTRLNIGGVLAFTLLGLYLYAVATSLMQAVACLKTSCPLDDGTALLLQTIGALVAAVVVSELSVTKPGDAPGAAIAVASQLSPRGVMACQDASLHLYCGVARVRGRASGRGNLAPGCATGK